MIMRSVAGQRAQHVMFRESAAGRLLPVSSQPRVLLQWTVQKYPMPVRTANPAATLAYENMGRSIVCAH